MKRGTTLKTENPGTSRSRILRAARAILGTRRGRLEADYEHGQWWVHDRLTGEAWSVIDAEGGRSVLGFDVEQVSEGDLDGQEE